MRNSHRELTEPPEPARNPHRKPPRTYIWAETPKRTNFWGCSQYIFFYLPSCLRACRKNEKSTFRQHGQMKSTCGKNQRREEKSREEKKRERIRKKKCRQAHKKVEISQIGVFFKRRVRSHLAGREIKNCTFFVAPTTCRSQNVQSTPCSEHFCKLRCGKNTRGCGPKHVSKSKVSKPVRFDTLLRVEMEKKCTPMWREAHLDVKTMKTPHVQTIFAR